MGFVLLGGSGAGSGVIDPAILRLKRTHAELLMGRTMLCIRGIGLLSTAT